MNSDEKHTCLHYCMAKICYVSFFGGPNMDALYQNTLLVLASSEEEISKAPNNHIELQYAAVSR